MRRRGIVDSQTLTESDAHELERLVAATNLTRLHRDDEHTEVEPDMFSYRIELEDGTKKYTVRVSDAEMSPELRRLIAWVKERSTA
jgi:hypothetical protein